MSDTPEPTSDAPAKGKPWIALIGALLAGAAVGTFVVAPRLGGSAEAPAAEAEAEHEATPEEEAAALERTFRLEGVIVNPAGTGGSRYMIVSIEYELKDASAAKRLRARETALRDAIGTILERRTIAELTAPGVRDRLRVELDSVALAVGGQKPNAVHLPQLLIQ